MPAHCVCVFEVSRTLHACGVVIICRDSMEERNKERGKEVIKEVHQDFHR